MKINEELAVLTALQKVVGSRLDAVRAEADAGMRQSYDEDGVTKKALKVGGAKVGDYIVTLTKGTWRVANAKEFEDFALSYGFARIDKSIRPEYMAMAIELLEDVEGALETKVTVDEKWPNFITNVDGHAFYMDSELEVPGLEWAPQRIKGLQVRGCNPDDVMPILRQLGVAPAALLSDSNNSEPEEA